MKIGHLDHVSTLDTVKFNLKWLLPGGMLVLFIVVMFGWMYIGLPISVIRDVEGSPTRESVGVVTNVNYAQPTRAKPVATSWITIRVDGMRADVNTVLAPRVGDDVKVTYRIGKSGRCYIDTMYPVVGSR